MYHYKGTAVESGNGMSKSGNLVELLKLARKNYNRVGMVGEITRADGTSIRNHSRNSISHPLANLPGLWRLSQ